MINIKSDLNKIFEYVFDYDKKYIENYVKSHGGENDLIKYILDNIDKCFNRKNYISLIIKQYFNQYSVLDLDGFIVFRLKEYRKILNEKINELTVKYEAVIDYNLYIEAIREVIKEQRQMINELNIIPLKNGYYIYDEFGNNLNYICRKILNEEFDYKFDYGDEFLLSAVITLAPERIIIRKYDKSCENNLIKTLKNVYKENFFAL